MTRIQNTPGQPYKTMVTDLWPQLGDEDPRQHRWDLAYRDVTTRTVAYRPAPNQPLRFVDPDETGPRRPPDQRLLLRVTCVEQLHKSSPVPTLAEVWRTAHGLLFIASIRGEAIDPRRPHPDPLEPPFAVRGPQPHRRARAPETGWAHQPFTAVRVMLDDDLMPDLWVKCRRHPGVRVNRAMLLGQLLLHERSDGRDTPGPRYVALNSVVAVSSP